jgi:TonB family protein
MKRIALLPTLCAGLISNWVCLAQEGATNQTTQPNAKLIEDYANAFTKRAKEVFNAGEFKKAVEQALKATKPAWEETGPGQAVVHFVVAENGEIEDLKVVESSGNAELEKAALESVRGAFIPVPPPDLPPKERTFDIRYVMKE